METAITNHSVTNLLRVKSNVSNNSLSIGISNRSFKNNTLPFWAIRSEGVALFDVYDNKYINFSSNLKSSALQSETSIKLSNSKNENVHQIAKRYHKWQNQKAIDFIHALTEITKDKGIKIYSFQSTFSIQFVTTDNGFEKLSNTEKYTQLHKKLYDKGVYLNPSATGTNYISELHSTQNLNKTLNEIYEILK